MPIFEYELDQHYDFHFTTHASTGTPTAATGTPSFQTFEGGATHQRVDTGDTTQLNTDLATAMYQVCSQLTTVKGFEIGKRYAILVDATVDSIAAEDLVGEFIVVPADVVREDVWSDAKAAFVDVSIASRSSHTAANVWTSATRTLTSYGTLVADVAAAVWVYANRTLTALSDTLWATLNTYLVNLHGDGAWNRGWNMAVSVQNTTLSVTGGLIDGDGHIWLTRDDDHDIDITLADASGVAINIGADTLYLTCRESDEETSTDDTDAVFQVLGAIISGVNGQARFEVGKTQTDTLTLNRHYYYDICKIAAHGDVVTPIKGRLTNTGDSTRRIA